VKYLFLLLILPLLLVSTPVTRAYGQESVQPSFPIISGTFYCVGNNPQPPCATIPPSQAAAVSSMPSNTVSQTPSQTPSRNPAPSNNPCGTTGSSVSSQNAGTSSVQALSKTKRHKPTGNGFIQQFFQFLLQLFQQLINQNPGTTNPSPSQSPSSPSTNPCPSSSAPSAAPSTAAATTPTVFMPSPTTTAAAPSSSPNSGVSPTSAPTNNQQPTNLLQQLLQLLLQLLQQLLQLIGVQPPCSTTSGCTTPNPTTTPGAPSSAPGGTSASPSSGAGKPSSGTPSSKPSSGAPSSSPSSGTPSSKPSSSAPSSSPSSGTPSRTAPQPSTGQTVSKAPPSATAGKTGLLESDIAAGTSTTNFLCLDDKGNSNANDNVVFTWACNSADSAQKWTTYSDNTIRINGSCLDVNKRGTANDTLVDLYTCNGGTNQQWKLVNITNGAAKGKTELQDQQDTRMCLDIKSSSTASGTQLEIYQCNNGKNQAWAWNYGTLPPSTSGNGATVTKTGSLQSASFAGTSKTTHLCMDDTNSSTTNGNKVQAWQCLSDAAQKWSEYSDGTIRWAGGTATNMCLDVLDQGKTKGTKVDLYTCNGGTNQVWTLNGSSELVSKQTGMCLDITGQSTANGTQLEIYTCNGGNNQKWSWGSSSSGSGSTGTGGTGSTSWSFPAPSSITVGSMGQSKSSALINISWSAVPNHGTTASTGYDVAAYSQSGSQIGTTHTTTPTTLTYSVNWLTPNSSVQIHVWANGGPEAPPHASTETITLGQTGTECDEKSPTDFLGTCKTTKGTAPAGGGLCNTGYYCDAN